MVRWIKHRIPMLLKLFNKIETEGTFTNFFYKAISTLLQKSHILNNNKKNEKKIIDHYPMNIDINVLNKIFVN